MRVVVTGATGNVGHRLAARLGGEAAVREIVGVARRRRTRAAPKTRWVQRRRRPRRPRAAPARRRRGRAPRLADPALARRAPSRTRSTSRAAARVFEAAAAAGVRGDRLRVLGRRLRPGPEGPRRRRVVADRPASRPRSTRATRRRSSAILDGFEAAHPRGPRRAPAPRADLPARRRPRGIRRLFAGPLLPRRSSRRELIPVVPAHAAARFQAVHRDDVADAYRLALLERRRARRLQRRRRPGARRRAGRGCSAPAPSRARPASCAAAAALTWHARLQPTAPGWVDLALGVPVMDTTARARRAGLDAGAGSAEALLELIDGMREGAGRRRRRTGGRARAPRAAPACGCGARPDRARAARRRYGCDRALGWRSGHGPAAPRPPDRDRRVVPGTRRAPTSHMHVGARHDLRGPAAALRGVPRPAPRRACTSCRATASGSPMPPLETGRPLWVDDPTFNLEYHVRQTALPQPGQRGAAAAPGRADLLPAARPLQAAVGDVARRGPRGRRLRADLQDPPRAHRRRRGRRPRDVLFDLDARARRTSAPRRAVAAAPEPSPARARRRAARWALVRAGLARRGARASGALTRPAARAARGARGGRGRRRDRVGRPEPRARDAAERARSARTGASPVVRSDLERLQAGQERVRRDGQRRRADRRQRRAARVAALARRAHRGPRAARARAGLDPRRRTSAARSATASPRCAGRCPSTSRTRSRGCARSRQAMDGLKESKQAVGAEVLAERAELRAADDPRAGVAAELLHPPVQPDRHQRARARSSRSTCAAARCEDVFPVAFLPKNHALAIAIMSYNGEINFGLLGDYDALPDLDAIADGIEASLAELRRARASRRQPAKSTNGRAAPRPAPHGLPHARHARVGPSAAPLRGCPRGRPRSEEP